MKNRNIFLSAGLALMAGVAFAGGQFGFPVEIDFDNGVAAGSQYSARTAKNDIERIGCGARTSTGGAVFGFCSARDKDDNAFACITFDPVLTHEIGAIGEWGFVSFNWDTNTGECTSIRWSKQSQYLPNVTIKGGN